MAKAVERHNAQARAEARHQASLERQRQDRAQAADAKQARDMARNQVALQAQSQAAAAKQLKPVVRTPLPYEDAADNQRTADALGKIKGVGDLPRFTTDAINTHGDRAINEVADLHERVADRDPAQADELLRLTRDGITETRREAFDAMFRRIPDTQGGKISIQPTEARQDINSSDDRMLEPGEKHVPPDQWSRDLKSLAGDLGNAAIDIPKSAWINQTGSPTEVKDNLSNLSKEYRARGYTSAADNLDHFLNGKGKPITITRDVARQDPFIAESEEENRKLFETRTFLGQTEKNTDVNNSLRDLKDGETIHLKDSWDNKRAVIPTYLDAVSPNVENRDNALAEGRKNFPANATFTATREGDKIVIKGTVTHGGKETYDFEARDLGDVMGAKGLADRGLAHNFDTIRQWGQTFEGTVDVSTGPKGNILSSPHFTWIDTWKDVNPSP